MAVELHSKLRRCMLRGDTPCILKSLPLIAQSLQSCIISVRVCLCMCVLVPEARQYCILLPIHQSTTPIVQSEPGPLPVSPYMEQPGMHL